MFQSFGEMALSQKAPGSFPESTTLGMVWLQGFPRNSHLKGASVQMKTLISWVGLARIRQMRWPAADVLR
jgi:hypothetical protein